MDVNDMQLLTPQHGPVLLRLVWRDADGRERWTVGKMNFRFQVRLEVGLDAPMQRDDFDGWKPLENTR